MFYTWKARRYREILEEVTPELMENVQLTQYNAIYFQQDGASSHNSALLKEFLEDNFSYRWIGTNRPVRWPPISPDISVLDFFCGFYKKSSL